jgi:H+/Cl- antiporter ClcA
METESKKQLNMLYYGVFLGIITSIVGNVFVTSFFEWMKITKLNELTYYPLIIFALLVGSIFVLYVIYDFIMEEIMS